MDTLPSAWREFLHYYPQCEHIFWLEPKSSLSVGGKGLQIIDKIRNVFSCFLDFVIFSKGSLPKKKCNNCYTWGRKSTSPFGELPRSPKGELNYLSPKSEAIKGHLYYIVQFPKRRTTQCTNWRTELYCILSSFDVARPCRKALKGHLYM